MPTQDTSPHGLSRLSPQNDERRNHPRTFCFFLCGGVACVDFFWCFPCAGHLRATLFFCCFYPVRPLLPFWAEHAFLALAVSGSSRVCRCGGTGLGSLFAPQSSCAGSSQRQGSHLPYNSVGLLRQPQVRRNPLASVVRYLQNSLCPGDVASRHPSPQANDVLMATLGRADGTAGCIVMESSRRAGPSRIGNASRRERHAGKERHPWSGEKVGNPGGQPAPGS